MTADVPFAEEDRDLHILIGYDGSDEAGSALRFAAEEARRRSVPLTVITAFKHPAMFFTNIASMPTESQDDARRDAARRTLEEAAEILKHQPGDVTLRSAEGDAAGVLVAFSSRAELVVVGARGRGGFAGRLLGSVASALPAHARCPTVVVPARRAGSAQTSDGAWGPAADGSGSASTAPVVAGVDGSDQSRTVLRVAAEQARLRGAPLTVFVALPLLDEWTYWYPEYQVDHESIEERREVLVRTVETRVAWLADEHPELDIRVTVEVGSAIDLLADESRTARLTVLGTRGRGTVRSALLGSVSRGVLNAAEGPVMIVPVATPDAT